MIALGDIRIKDMYLGEINIASAMLNGEDILSKSPIPKEYQQVEYIQSSGTQYIDTKIIATSNIKVVSDFAYNSFTSDDTKYIGIYDGTGPTELIGTSDNQYRLVPYGVDWGNQILCGTVNSSKHTIILNDNRNYIFDGVVKKTLTNTWSTSLSYWLFNSHGDSKPCSAKCYTLQFYDNRTDELLADFIPCYRKTDKVVGMYEVVSGQFFTNIGSGTFIAGGDV